MPNLFNGYCYGTIQDAASAEIGSSSISGSSGVAAAVGFTATTVTDGNMTYRYKPYSSTVASTYVLLKTYPSCPGVGYLTNYSGMSISDVVETSWLVVLVWVMAWGIKRLRGVL